MTSAPRPWLSTAALALAVVAVAVNQRPAVVAAAPLVDQIRADTGLTSSGAGLLTALPVLCFGLFAPFVPSLARRIGLEVAVAASLLLLAVGIALRLLPPLGFLFLGTVVLGASITVTNVLLPAYVKRTFSRPGPVMGAYTASLNLGAAAAAAATLPLGSMLGVSWRVTLGLWGVVTVLSLAVWLPTLRSRLSVRPRAAAMLPAPAWLILRQPLARQITTFFALQSLLFYTIAAWLPVILADAGLTLAQGGMLLGVSSVVGAVPALVLPAVSGAMRTQRPLLVGVMSLFAVGLGGLLLAPATGTLAWVCAFGLAQGGGFGLALTLFAIRSDSALTTARLSGVGQCLGYTVAAAGPLTIGGVYDLTHEWTWPIAILIIALVPMTWAGWGATDDVVLSPDAQRARKAVAP